MQEILSDLRLYRRLIVIQIRGQMQYKLNIVIDILTYFAVTGLEFVTMLLYFVPFPTMLGWRVGEVAMLAAGAVCDAVVRVVAGEDHHALCLVRPPGHHATRNRAMGFCYFNNIAIAALDALANRVERVGIWDFDAHHGNGTEGIVAHNPRIAFTSVHQFPAYPGTGAKSFGNITNYPVAPYTPRARHVDIVERALQNLLEFNPNLLLVSAGFDAYSGDPLVQMTLEQEDFAKFGEWLRKVAVPTAAILEGGYSDELPELIDAFLSAWNG